MNVQGTQYKIGENPVIMHVKANTKHTTVSFLKEGDGASVIDMEHGNDDNWSYAIVAAVVHTGSLPYLSP